MISVRKYLLPLPTHDTVMSIPSGAQPLTVALPRSAAPGWERCLEVHALVDDRAPLVTRRFTVVATGEPLGPHVGLQHLGTVRAQGKTLHVFDTGVETPHGD